jgi:hypothetical protein
VWTERVIIKVTIRKGGSLLHTGIPARVLPRGVARPVGLWELPGIYVPTFVMIKKFKNVTKIKILF